jgi:betaine-homocysteine S-methyltransferase
MMQYFTRFGSTVVTQEPWFPLIHFTHADFLIISSLARPAAKEPAMKSASAPSRPGLFERLQEGPVLCAEGYVFELERRGYVQAGPFVPTVVLEHPEAVEQLHRELVRAGSDVVEALTYYAHREKLRIVGLEGSLEELNRQALRIARRVAVEFNALVAGGVCNTNIYDPDSPGSHTAVRRTFEEQVAWAAEEGVDFIIGETFAFLGEALIALEVIRQTKLPAVVTFAIHRHGLLRDGATPEAACKALADAGADVVGLNCARGPATMLPLLKRIRAAVAGHVAALPVPYRTHDAEPTFQSLTDPSSAEPPGRRAFPTALDPFLCTRYEMAEFARQAQALGVRYLGACCGAGPHHVRSMAEALGKSPPASQCSPDMAKHYALGTDERLLPHNKGFARDL